MSKANRIRAKHAGEKKKAQTALAQPIVSKAMNKEINQHLLNAIDRFMRDEVAVMLLCLHDVCGFGKVRLKRFYDAYTEHNEELRKHYEMSDDDLPYVAREILKDRYGVDLDEWEQEERKREESGKNG